MILSATLSKPVSNIEEICGRAYEKIKISYENSGTGGAYFVQEFTKTQVFHEHLSESELEDFLNKNIGITFKSCVQKTESEEITFLTNKKGKTTRLCKKITKAQESFLSQNHLIPLSQKKKNYIISENTPVPFLVLLKIMNSEGKILSKKYDKFRQINKFLEFIDDVIPQIQKMKEKNGEEKTIRIIDFGSGKSYLTFAVHYYLTQIKKIPCSIHGLDLKQEVIDYCNDIAKKLKLENLSFTTGNIETFKSDYSPDLIITLHACDKATDYALKYAVEKNTKVILSVPCCQHEINTTLSQNKDKIQNEDFSLLLKWGLIREKFSSLLTDALRGEWLEQNGYKVSMLEFIDEENSPKNLMIRAIKKEGSKEKSSKPSVLKTLNINPEIWK